jgi:hypothetical protein
MEALGINMKVRRCRGSRVAVLQGIHSNVSTSPFQWIILIRRRVRIRRSAFLSFVYVVESTRRRISCSILEDQGAVVCD